MNLKIRCFVEKRIKTLKDTGAIFVLQWRTEPRLLISVIISTLLANAKAILEVIMPALMIDALEKEHGVSRIISYSLIFALSVVICNMTKKSLSLYATAYGYRLANLMTYNVGKKGIRKDYKDWEDPESLDATLRAVTGVWEFLDVGDLILETLLGSIITFVAMSYILNQLHTLVWLFLIAVIIISIVIETIMNNKSHKLHNELASLQRPVEYIKSILRNISTGKELRLYSSLEFIHNQYKSVMDKSTKAYEKRENTEVRKMMWNDILNWVQSIVVYGSAIYLFFSGSITISAFVLYLGAINQMNGAIRGFFKTVSGLERVTPYFTDYQDIMRTEETLRTGSTSTENQEDLTICCDNIEFAYPKTEKNVIDGISLFLPQGQKLAIVGENGSGKTTFIKLIMRLFDVDKGKITLNSLPISSFDYESYMNLFSPVFQEYILHSFSVRENIAFDVDDCKDEDNIYGLLQKYGMEERVRICKNGLDTYVTKMLEEDGEDFSGGEKQKLATVRAIYKNGEIAIFDEPTSALDPFAEQEYYKNMFEYVHDKTAIFISHRLSSTRYADKIAVFGGGKIIEYGSFDELMAKGGVFTHMFNMQASYYKATTAAQA